MAVYDKFARQISENTKLVTQLVSAVMNSVVHIYKNLQWWWHTVKKLAQVSCIKFSCTFVQVLVWHRAVLYSVQETCTRKILYKKPCQTVKFLVQVDLYTFLVQVSWLCVTTIGNWNWQTGISRSFVRRITKHDLRLKTCKRLSGLLSFARWLHFFSKVIWNKLWQC